MNERFVVRVIRAGNGERQPMVIDAATCLPVFEATIYATSLSRPASGSHSTVEQELRGVAGLHRFLDARSISFAARVASCEFLTVPEMDGLVAHFGQPGRARRRGTTRRPGERTVVLRVWACLRYLAFLIDLHAHGAWSTPEAQAAFTAAKAEFLTDLAARARMPRPKDATRQALTAEQEAVLMSAVVEMARQAEASGNADSIFAADRTALWFDWAVELGLRTGELLGLRLPDIDLDARTVRVVRRPDAADDPRRDLARVKGEGRELDISPYLAARTRAHVKVARAARPGARGHGFLFVSARGAPLSRSAVNKIFAVLRRGYPILGEHFCTHVMRHLWNETFSADATAAGLSAAEEMAARAYALGWRDEGSARAYLAHRTRRRAAEVSRHSQERQMAVRTVALG